jgi:bile acid-coenzyme A ligase
MAEQASEAISFGARLGQLAAGQPDAPALIWMDIQGNETTVSFAELERRSNQLARWLHGKGVLQGDLVAVGLHNCPEHVMCDFAASKLGAVPVPMRWDLPDWERQRVLDAMEPRVVIDASTFDEVRATVSLDDGPVEDRTSPHSHGTCSGGSTGTPKVILQRVPGAYQKAGLNPVVEIWKPLSVDQRVLCPAPLYHTNGYTMIRNVLEGLTSLFFEKFDPVLFLDQLEKHRATGFIAATPFLQRLLRVDDIDERDLSSLEWVQQGAAPLPIWLGRALCDMLGAENFFMSFGSTEGAGLIACRGDEYLAHPGTLGRPLPGHELKILDDDFNELPPGEVGHIFMRAPTGPPATYLGKDVKQVLQSPDGLATVGDLGWVDEDGWVYLADRRVDMIVSGGANIFPAEVEAALSEHEGVDDVVVIGLADEEWGHRVHAIVQPARGASLTEAEMIAFAKERLASYKAPKSVEFIETMPRTDSMKINRSRLVEERSS